MEELRIERNALLRYALQHRPANIELLFPKGSKSLDDIDLSLFPMPLALFVKAEANPSRTYTIDISKHLTYKSGSSGGVQRREGTTPPFSSTTIMLDESRPRQLSPDPVGSPHYTSISNNHAAESPNVTLVAGSSHHHPDGTAPQSTSAISAFKRGFAHLFGSGAAASTATAAGSSNASATATFTTAAAGVGGVVGATGLESGSSFSKIIPLRNSLAHIRPQSMLRPNSAPESAAHSPRTGRRRSSTSTSTTSAAAAAVAAMSSRREAASRAVSPLSVGARPHCAARLELDDGLQLIPLNGTTRGSLAENIDRISPVVEKRVKSLFPRPFDIDLVPVFGSALLDVFNDDFLIDVYEHLLVVAGLLLVNGPERQNFEREIFGVYGPVFGITLEQHSQCVCNLLPPGMTCSDYSNPDFEAQVRDYVKGLRIDENSVQSLMERSTNTDFKERLSSQLIAFKKFPDDPGDQAGLYPLFVRAVLFAGSLLPLYRIDVALCRPVVVDADIKTCVNALRRSLDIPDSIVPYCRLHAHLLANEGISDMKAYAVFLKTAAHMVNALKPRTLARKPLTPVVKYGYYVLQEAFGASITPMPWLETIESTDVLRCMSAMFMETCLALPPCFLSTFVLVNGTHVLPASCTSGEFLLAFLSVFISMGLLRSFDSRDGAVEMKASTPVSVALAAVQAMSAKQIMYCNMLKRSLPMSSALLIPCMMELGSYLTLKHWCIVYHAGNIDASEDEINKRITSTMEAAAAAHRVMTAAKVGASGSAASTAATGGVKETSTKTPAPTTVGPVLMSMPDSGTVYPIPKDLVKCVAELLQFLLTAAPAGVQQDGEMRHILSKAAEQHLCVIGALVLQHCEMLKADVTGKAPSSAGNGMVGIPAWKWAGAGGGGGGGTSYLTPLDEAVEYTCTHVCSFPAPLGIAPHVLFTETAKRLALCVPLLFGTIALPLSALERKSNGQLLPGICAEYRHVLTIYKVVGKNDCNDTSTDQNKKKPTASSSPSSSPSPEELMHRINTAERLRKDVCAACNVATKQYEETRLVTGAPPAPPGTKANLTEARNAATEAYLRSCEWLAVSVVSRSRAFTMITEELLKVDTKHHHSQKKQQQQQQSSRRNSGSGQNRMVPAIADSYPRTFPGTTVTSILAAIMPVYIEAASGLASAESQWAVRLYIGQHVTALLYGTYVEGKDVLLEPEQAEDILQDLQLVHLFAFPEDAPSSVANNSSLVGGGSFNGPISTSVPSSSSVSPPSLSTQGATTNFPSAGSLASVICTGPLLFELRNIVRYVMSQPSTMLVNGGDGVPPFNGLPEFVTNSPWCKYILRNVLERRKEKTIALGGQRFMWKSS